MPATIIDVAQRAKVAPSTVSRVLNQSGYASEETRTRVHKAVEELQYQSGRTARSKSSLIGLLIPDILNAYFAQVAQYILNNLKKQEHNLLVQITNEDPDLESASLRMLQGSTIDGLISVPVISRKNSGLIRDMAARGLPMIELSRQREVDILDAVLADNVGGSYMAVERLLQLGHRRIAIVNASADSGTAQDRYLGYKKALQDYDVEIDDRLVKAKEPSKAWGIEAVQMLMRADPRPTAIFVTSNRLLLGVLTTLMDQQIRVPEDISIISFDDPEWLSVSQPPITTVGVAMEEMAELATQLILKRIEDGRPRDKPVTYSLSVHLIERQSCARIA